MIEPRVIESRALVIRDEEPSLPPGESAVMRGRWTCGRWASEIDRRRRFDPNDFIEASKIAEALWRSRILPKAIDSPEMALAIIVQGNELGLSPMQSLRGLFIIEGRVCMAAQTMVALVEQSGAAVYFRQVESTEESSTWETQRHGHPEPMRYTFTLKEAERAGLTRRKTWQEYPRAMMSWRAAAMLARTAFADVVGGLYTPEELGYDESKPERRTGTRDRRDAPRGPDRRAPQEVHATPQATAPKPQTQPAVTDPVPPAQQEPDEFRALKRELIKLVGKDEAKRRWKEVVEPGPIGWLRERARAEIYAAKARAETARESAEEAEPEAKPEPAPAAPPASCETCTTTGLVKCERCKGYGKVTCQLCADPKWGARTSGPCPRCKCDKSFTQPCPGCEGKGDRPCPACTLPSAQADLPMDAKPEAERVPGGDG